MGAEERVEEKPEGRAVRPSAGKAGRSRKSARCRVDLGPR